MALATAALWLCAAPTAGAEWTNVCLPGEGPGDCNGPEGVATNFTSELLYVADRGHHRVNVYEGETGEFEESFGSGPGSGPGELNEPRSIAVDNAGASGDVYVIDANARVNHFDDEGNFIDSFGSSVGECALSGGSLVSVGFGGAVYVLSGAGKRVAKWNGETGLCEEEFTLFEDGRRLKAMVADSLEADVVYGAIEGEAGEPKKFDLASATATCALDPGINTLALGIDGTGHVYAFQVEDRAFGGSPYRVVTEYEPSCETARRYGYGEIPTFLSYLASLHTAEGDVFLSEGNLGINYVTEPPPGPLLIAESLKVTEGNAQAKLRLEGNSEGKVTGVGIEFVPEEAYDKDIEEGGDGFEGPETKSIEAEDLPFEEKEGISYHFRARGIEPLLGCAKATKEAIEEGKCLFPETTYRFRATATNPDGKGTLEGSFTTKEAIEIVSIFASEVDTTTATINARVNPLGIPATGFFEYVDDAAYEEDLEEGGDGFAEATQVPAVEEGATPLDFGGGEAPLRQRATLFPLAEGTTYHYRLAAINDLIDEHQLSEERTFTTRRAAESPHCPNDELRPGPGALLPDCRAYELVSPLDKASSDIVALPQVLTRLAAALYQSTPEGERFAYGAANAFGDAKAAPYTSQYVASRDPQAGWSSHGINPAREELIVDGVQFESEYHVFSEDLCEGWIVPLNEPPLAPGATPDHKNLYRGEGLCGGEEAYVPFTGEPERLSTALDVEGQGFSEDGEIAAWAANDTMAGSGAPAQSSECEDANTNTCQRRLYAQAEGEAPRYACVLPNGDLHGGSCQAGAGIGAPVLGEGRLFNLTGALSADGSHLYWTASDGLGPIYLRLNPTEDESAREFGQGEGTATMAGPASASGDIASASNKITNLKVTSGAFVLGQEVQGPGIPAATTLVGVSGSQLTLSAPATATQAGATVGGLASAKLTKAKATSGSFVVGQSIAATNGGIPKGTTIEAVEGEVLTLSAKATLSANNSAIETSSDCSEPTKACTYPVSEDGEAASKTSTSRFWWAASDGSRALYITGEDLYAYDAGAKASEKLAGKAKGLVGASEDASRVYFVSTEALGEANPQGKEAEPNKGNLYLDEEGAGEPRFIVTLADADLAAPDAPGVGGPIASAPEHRNSRVSPSGLSAAFTSRGDLSGYDNTDEGSEEADSEVYLYDAEAGEGAGELLCVSCNPSGAAPQGADLGTPTTPFWVAARLPVWQTSLYPGRYLADDGDRLFFESQDALAVRDTNSRLDVYQWERAGKGTCEQESPSYSAAAKGCIDLISSGDSNRDSTLLDASPSGEDVFFATLSSLWGPDYGLVDVYDARVQGGFPAPPPGPLPCEGESCQNPPPAPQPPAPSSSTYTGPGNLAAPKAKKRCPKGKHKVKRKGKVRCVKKKSKKRAHRRHDRSAARSR